MNRSSRAHLAPVQASCWNAASPSLFCLLPLKSTDSNGRSWRPAWKNCSALTLTSARYGERLNADLNVMSFWNAPVKGVLFTVSCQTSLHSTSCFIPSLAYPWHLLYNVLPVLRHSTIWPKSMPGIPVPASEFCPLDCKSTSLAKFRYWTDAPGSTWALVSTVWSSHTPKDHTVWLWNRLYSYASSHSNTPVAERLNIKHTAYLLHSQQEPWSSPKLFQILEWYCIWISVCMFVPVRVCVCVCALKSMPSSIGKKKDQAKIPQNFMWDHWRGIYNLEHPSCQAEVILIQQTGFPSPTFPNRFCVIHAPQK